MSYTPPGKMRQARRIRLCVLAVALLLCAYWIYFAAKFLILHRVHYDHFLSDILEADMRKIFIIPLNVIVSTLFINITGSVAVVKGDEVTLNVGEPPVLSLGIPQEWIEMCDFLEGDLQGNEGPIDDTAYRLRGIAIAFRHGERSPMHSADAHDACAPYRELDRRDFELYKKLIESEDFQFFLRHDSKFKKYPRVPSYSECSPGQMTAEGALQHVKLGKYMRNKYAGSNIFSPESRLNVSVTSSQFNRTFQSAVAFTSSFLYPSKTSIPQIYIQASDFTFMCTNKICQCSLAKQWRHQYEEEHAGYFRKRSPEELRVFADALRMHSAFTKTVDPIQMMDVALGRFVCRRRSLPCFGKGKCLTYEFLSKLLNETSVRGKVMFDEGPRYVAQKLQLVEAYGVLFHLVETVVKLRSFPHTNVIQIFSGHDVMLAPLLRVMGVPFTDPPHYASHLVIEFYEAIDSPSAKDVLLLRFIYNGVDITKSVNFCEVVLKNGLCPAQQLENFVQKRIFSSLGVTSLKDICT